MTDPASVFVDLERTLDKDYAVAFRKIGHRVHVRAVREGKIYESECTSIAEAISDVYSQITSRTKKREIEARGK